MSVSITSNKLEGLDALTAVLNGLPEEMRTKLMVSAVREAAIPLEANMKQAAPRDSGALQDAIGTKVVSYPRNGVAIAIVGVRRKLKYWVNGKLRIPSKYAHIVEFGSSKRAAHPFVRPAYAVSLPEIKSSLLGGMRRGLNSAFRRLNK